MCQLTPPRPVQQSSFGEGYSPHEGGPHGGDPESDWIGITFVGGGQWQGYGEK